MKAKTKPFYGWAIVAAAMLIMISVYGVVNNCYSFYIEPVTTDLGLSHQGYSLSQAAVFIGLMVTAPFVGAVYRRVDLMKMMRAAIVVLVLAYACYGLCSKIWQFCTISFIIGVSECFITTIPLSIIIRNWFERSYGLALGLAFMGSGIGGMIMSPLIHTLTLNAGWRTTFFIVAGIMGAVNILSVFILLKAKPADMGLEPLRDSSAAPGSDAELTGDALTDTLKRPSFYAMLLLSLLFAVTSYGLCTYIGPYYTELGHSAAAISICTSSAMGIMAGGKILFGRILDKIGLKPATLLSMASAIIGFVGMIYSRNLYMFALVLFGVMIGCPFGTIAPAVIVKEVYGTRDFGSKLGFYSIAANLGSALSPFFAGFIFDRTGGYDDAMWILFYVSIAIFLGYLLILPGKRRAAHGRRI